MKKWVLIFLLSPYLLGAQVRQEQKMQWFEDAKLGIFIHWGLYSVNGISESWAFYNKYISHEDYMQQTSGFTAENYHPEYWAELIEQSGAKYTVITSKHHEGFALWDSKFGDLNAVKAAAAGRDVLTPFVSAIHKRNLKVGLYFSLPDWSYGDYTHFTRTERRYDLHEEPQRWQTFLDYSHGQLRELRDRYNPDLWWFDGDWEHSAEEWQVDHIKTFLAEKNKNVIFNSRLNGRGDYETPEIGLPVLRPQARYWELCMTMNDSWGYQYNDHNYKSPQQIIDIFVDCISKGGNLLLDIGPKGDGSIPEEQVHILQELGKWTRKHEEAIFGTRRGIPYDHFYGPTALSPDSTTLFLYVRDIPKDGKVILKGVKNKINRAYVVGEASILDQETFCSVYWSAYPGLTYIELPEQALDEYYTVIAVLLDGPIQLFREKTGAIESNW